jgi:hypothetical protein
MPTRACLGATQTVGHATSSDCGAVAEWSKALAWKVSIRQKRIEGSNPSRSAIDLFPAVRIGPPESTFLS